MPVTSQHSTYAAAADKWKTVRDCVSGQKAVKAAKTRYLPGFVPEDKARYDAYVKRARFLNVTGRTLKALTGAVFRKDPEIELPAELEYLLENMDGSGQSVTQLAKRAVDEDLTIGRYGLLVDFPAADENLTAEQVAMLELQAYAAPYTAENIINWKTSVINGKLSYTLIVLKEMIEIPVDEFESRSEPQYRVLSLIDNIYQQNIYNEKGDLVEGPIIPKQGNGEYWPIIPFVFLGAQDNKPDVDEPPLYDLAETNISHYQVSADHMENLHIHGQLTLGISSSLSVEQFKEANPNGVAVGSRSGHFLGEGGSFTTATAPESTSLSKALEDIKADMVAIGGRIIQTRSGNQTAEAARIDASSEHSVLQTLVGNVSEGIEQVIEYIAMFMNADPEKVAFQLNRDFFDVQPDPQMVMALMGLRDAGDIATADVRAYLRKTGALAEDRTDQDLDLEAEVRPVL